MIRNKKEEQIQKIMLLQEEIQLWIQYILQQWERKKQEQHNPFPKLAYTETMAFKHSEAYQAIKILCVEMVRDLTGDKREKQLVQIEELHQQMQNSVAAVLETTQKFSAS
ncbi:hypothetical protein ACO1D2_15400 [Bacillus thuringiensis]|uniref:hypothetical protein n=1 Tax=Bacillus thuringiensis TaxID=1428 RepID=UPI003BF6EA62